MRSAVIQGSILGIRLNDMQVCRGQLWVLAVHCLVVFGAAAYFRPCGALFSNVFLVLSKLAAFVVSSLVLVHSLTLDDNFANWAEIATSLATAIATAQTLIQIITAVLQINTPTHSVSRLLRLFRKSKQHAAVSRRQDKEQCDPDARMRLDVNTGKLLVAAGDEQEEEQLRGIMGPAGGAAERRAVMEHLIRAMDPKVPRLDRLDCLLRAAAGQAQASGRRRRQQFLLEDVAEPLR